MMFAKMYTCLVLILFLMLPSKGIKFRSDGSPDTAVLPYAK